MSFSICKTLTMSCVNGGNRKRDKRVNGEGSGDLRHSGLVGSKAGLRVGETRAGLAQS